VLKTGGLSMLVTNLRRSSDIDREVTWLQQFKPRAIVYAAMFHKLIEFSDHAADAISVAINCQSNRADVPSLVPDEFAAAKEIAGRMFASGRRHAVFLSLPGLMAGDLREKGFRAAEAEAGAGPWPGNVRAAVAAPVFHDRAQSLVQDHLDAWFSESEPPDAVLCGNDRIAMEVYNGLRRLGRAIPQDVAVTSFDNQVEIARRFEPPLTTMALPYRAMARAAAEALVSGVPLLRGTTMFPFHLVARGSL
jgi:DNA-binding LacI/PurR family transcriptional regulator